VPNFKWDKEGKRLNIKEVGYQVNDGPTEGGIKLGLNNTELSFRLTKKGLTKFIVRLKIA